MAECGLVEFQDVRSEQIRGVEHLTWLIFLVPWRSEVSGYRLSSTCLLEDRAP